MTEILQSSPLAGFSCLCERCEDTCCKGWSMQLDEPMLAKYKNEAPQLLSAVEIDGAAGDASWIMRKDAASGYCVKLEDGLCGIHKSYGAAFLGNACYFYPRITRSLGDKIIMTAALSCPEITRLALRESAAPFFAPANTDRLPHGMRDYLPEGLSSDAALSIHQHFLDAADDPSANVETIFCRIYSVAHSLQYIAPKDWPGAAAVYLSLADGRVPPAEKNINDAFNLLHALCGLIVASKKTMSSRLKQTIEDIERALCATLDWDNVLIHTGDQSAAAVQHLVQIYRSQAHKQLDPILKKYLKMQLSIALFPFSGFGNSLPERANTVGVRLATMKLALLCRYGMNEDMIPPEEVVRVVQSVSRFLDHLGNPDFSLQIYAECGWNKEARMRGLLEL